MLKLSSLLVFQGPNEQLEDTQCKGIGAGQTKQHEKMCKLAAQRNAIKLQAKGSTATQI